METEEEGRDQNCGPEVTLPEAMDLTEPERWMWMLTAWLPSLPSQGCCRWIELSWCPSQVSEGKDGDQAKAALRVTQPPGLKQRDVCICTLPPLKEPRGQLSALERATRLQEPRAFSSCGGRGHFHPGNPRRRRQACLCEYQVPAILQRARLRLEEGCQAQDRGSCHWGACARAQSLFG